MHSLPNVLHGRLGVESLSRLALAALLLLVVGCELATSAAQHPIVTVPSKSRAATAMSPFDPDLSTHFLAVYRGFGNVGPGLSIGTSAGPPPTIFGMMLDVVTSSAGDVHVLDVATSEVRVFAPDGAYLRTLSARFDSTHGLRRPFAIDITANDELVVAGAGGLTFFKVSESYSVAKTVSYDEGLPGPSGVCVVDGTAFVRTSTSQGSPNVIRAFDIMSDQGSYAFGAGYSYGAALTQGELSTGVTACVADPPTVLVAFTYLPVVYAYAPNGDLLWTLHVDGFEPRVFVEGKTPDGRATFAMRRQIPGDIVLSLTSMDSGLALLQVARVGPGPAPGDRSYSVQRIHRIDSILVDVAAGLARIVDRRLPHVLAGRGSRLWTAVTDSLGGFTRLEGLEIDSANESE